MAKITINRVVDEERGGIEFSRVHFNVEGGASEQEIQAALVEQMDDLANFEFNPATGKGTCVTIDHDPEVGALFNVGNSNPLAEEVKDEKASGSKQLDYVAMTKEGDILVEFASSGVTKRFMRIHTGRGLADDYYSTSHRLTTTVFLEEDSLDRFSLVLEVHEQGYSNEIKLRRCIVEYFTGDEVANAALNKMKTILGVGVEETKSLTVDGTEEFSPTQKRKSGFMEVLAGAALITLGVALSVGAIGAGLGGWALFSKFHG